MNRKGSQLLDLYIAYDQWKQEHDLLHDRLLELCKSMKWNPGNYEHDDWDSIHRKVRESFIPFMQDWQRHMSIERETIYPVAASAICGGRMGPVAVLEQDDRLAGEFYEAYEKACKEGVASENALSYLFQVLMIIAEHFRLENETVVPVTERLMDEIEYCGS